MKKIINGKKYDTETAKHVGSWSNGYSYSDFEYAKEKLYKNKTGEFFLYGSGGPASKYCEYIDGNTRSGGCDIIPLTENKAKKWAERHLDADRYEEIFGEVEE